MSDSQKDLTFALLILIGLLLPTISAYWIFGNVKLTPDIYPSFLLFISIAIPISYRIGSIAIQIYDNQKETN